MNLDRSLIDIVERDNGHHDVVTVKCGDAIVGWFDNSNSPEDKIVTHYGSDNSLGKEGRQYVLYAAEIWGWGLNENIIRWASC